MGKDLRVSRPEHSYERFLVYPANTTKKEILEHSKIASGVFRGTGGVNAVYTKDEAGNIVKTFTKADQVITTDRIDIKVGDIVYNQYAKEVYIVTSWEEDEEPSSLEFSLRPICRRIINLKGMQNG